MLKDDLPYSYPHFHLILNSDYSLVDVQTIGVLVTAASVSVAAIYYAFTLRINMKNQELSLKALEQSAKAQELNLKTQQQTLETRQAQMFMNIYQQTMTKDFMSAWNLFTSSKWKNYSEYWKLLQKKEFANAASILNMYWEGLGVLVKEEFLSIRLVALLITGMTRVFWEKLKPIKDEARADMGYARWMSETEYLYDELLRYLGEHPELSSEWKKPWQSK